MMLQINTILYLYKMYSVICALREVNFSLVKSPLFYINVQCFSSDTSERLNDLKNCVSMSRIT